MIDARKVYLWLRIALAVLALAAISHRAMADTIDLLGPYNPATNAYNSCNTHKASLVASGYIISQSCSHVGTVPGGGLLCNKNTGARGFYGIYVVRFRYSWEADANSTCRGFGYSVSGCTAPQVPGPDGICYDPNAACAAIKARTENPLDGLYIPPNNLRTYLGTAPDQCIGGCTWATKPGVGKVTTGTGADAMTTAAYGFTGNACPVTPESPSPPDNKVPPAPNDQVCRTAAGSQLTLCIRQDGKHCYATTSGKQICWNPGETGNKTDGPISQKRDPGTVAAPTPPPAPPGDTVNQTGSPTPTTTTTVINNTTTTTNTTTTNFTTTSGADAGPTNSGVPSTGTGGAGGGTAPGPSDSVSAGSCTTNYTCAGGSAIECAALQETTKARCALEAQNPNREMTGTEMTNLTGEGSGTGTAEAEGAREDDEHGQSGLDSDGMGWSNTCPTLDPIEVFGQSVAFDTSTFCDWMNAVGALVLLFAALGALRILGGAI